MEARVVQLENSSRDFMTRVDGMMATVSSNDVDAKASMNANDVKV